MTKQKLSIYSLSYFIIGFPFLLFALGFSLSNILELEVEDFNALYLGSALVILGIIHIISLQILFKNEKEETSKMKKWKIFLIIYSISCLIFIPDFLGVLVLILCLGEIFFINKLNKKKLQPQVLEKEIQENKDLGGKEPESLEDSKHVQEDRDFFIPKKLEKITLWFIYVVFLAWGIIMLIIENNPFFLVLGIGELGLYYILKFKWNQAKSNIEKLKQAKKPLKRISFMKYVWLVYLYSMLMEFCVDFGNYNTLNPMIVLIIMAVLTPHYIIMAFAIRLWLIWFDFTPRQLYLTIGIVGYLMEVVLLPLIGNIFDPILVILGLIVSYPIHALNYGGFVVIPHLYHTESTTHVKENKEEKEEKSWIKYLVCIIGTLLISIPAILIMYRFMWGIL